MGPALINTMGHRYPDSRIRRASVSPSISGMCMSQMMRSGTCWAKCANTARASYIASALNPRYPSRSVMTSAYGLWSSMTRIVFAMAIVGTARLGRLCRWCNSCNDSVVSRWHNISPGVRDRLTGYQRLQPDGRAPMPPFISPAVTLHLTEGSTRLETRSK
jgi:hypothetical protein